MNGTEEADRNDTDGERGTELVELIAEGDRELWCAEGSDGSWRFPLWIDWRRNLKEGRLYASVLPCLVPYFKQGLFLKALFEAHNLIERDNHWLIRAEMVPALLKKAPGITPSKYYKWPNKEGLEPIEPVRFRWVNKETQGKEPAWLWRGRDRAVVGLTARAAGVSTSVVKVVLDGLNRAAPDILIEQREPIDLGFVKILALPYRGNWKEIVAFKLRKSKRAELLVGLGKFDKDALAAAGIPEMLCSPHNIGIKRRKDSEMGHIDYTLEALASKSFEKELMKRQVRKASRGRSAYVWHFEKTIETLYDDILEILRAYLRKTAHPFARVYESGRTGSLRFVATLGHKVRAFNAALRRLPVHIVASRSGFSALAEGSDFRLVSTAAAEVPEVPVVSQGAERPAINDVWERQQQRDLQAVIGRPSGDIGLPVPDAGQGIAAGGPVLPESTVETGDASGVDREGD